MIFIKISSIIKTLFVFEKLSILNFRLLKLSLSLNPMYSIYHHYRIIFQIVFIKIHIFKLPNTLTCCFIDFVKSNNPVLTLETIFCITIIN